MFTTAWTKSPEVRDRMLAAIADEPPRQPRRRRHHPRRASTPSSTSCATSAATAGSTSRRSRRASARAPASSRSRSASTTSSATTSRSRKANHAPGARRLRAQADAGQRRALHHAGAEGATSARCWTPRRRSWSSSASSSPRCAAFAAAQAQRIRATAAAVAELDVTAALAQVAAENRYTRPRFSDAGEMRIVAGPPSGDRAAGGAGGRALHSQRSVT